jgi:hypothetical protein
MMRLKVVGAVSSALLLSTMIVTRPAAWAETPAAPVPATEAWVYGEYPVGAKVYPMVGAQILEQPNAKAKPIASFKETDGPFTILEKTKGWMKLFGVKDNFYKVQRGSTIGYVYAGWLAKSAVEDDLDGDGVKESIRIGWTKRTKNIKDGEFRPLAEVRVIKAGKVVASTTFEPIGMIEGEQFGYSIRAKAIGSQGLSRARLLKVSFEYGACDYPNGDVLLVWSGGKIQKGLTAISSGNEQGGVTFRYIFPASPGGKPDRITLVEKMDELNEQGKLVRSSEERHIYRWDGMTLKGPQKVAKK